MTANMLKLNQEKTELIIFAPKHQVKRFKPQQSIFGNASGIFQTIEKYLMVNGIKRCR
jgi:hypothetical protein